VTSSPRFHRSGPLSFPRRCGPLALRRPSPMKTTSSRAQSRPRERCGMTLRHSSPRRRRTEAVQIPVTAGPPAGPPQRLRPPRWTSQRVSATEATTAMMSRMSVVTAVIYRAILHPGPGCLHPALEAGRADPGVSAFVRSRKSRPRSSTCTRCCAPPTAPSCWG
jgi:hypothetical protein